MSAVDNGSGKTSASVRSLNHGTSVNAAGAYRRLRVVGRGSFGCCWLVQTPAGDQCILKQIDVSKMSAVLKKEAANDVKVLKRLRHPFIIKYYESYVEDGLLCIVTEFAERGDMYHVIHQQKVARVFFPEFAVLRWFTQVALAIKHMHDRKILHRDLKTQNIFLSLLGTDIHHGTVKLGDFGIARVLQHTQDCARTAIGTPFYLSPEICQEKPYSYKSDVWSFGCVLFEFATLEHAFDADSMRGLVMKILRGVPPSIPSGFSVDTKNLVDEMLTKDPDQRPSIDDILHRRSVRKTIRHLLDEVEQGRRCKGLSPTPQSSENRKKCVTQQGRRDGCARDVGHCRSAASQRLYSSSIKPVGSCNTLRKSSKHESVYDYRQKPQSSSAGSQPNECLEPFTASDKSRIVISPHVSSSDVAGCNQRQCELSECISTPASQFDSRVHTALAEKVSGEVDEERSQLLATLQEGLRVHSDAKANVEKENRNNEKVGSQLVVGKVCSSASAEPRFVRPDGATVCLPVSERDSLTYRIEALRVYLEEELGLDDFLLVYRHLNECTSPEAATVSLEAVVTPKAIEFLPLVHQLLVCEDKCFKD